MGSIFLSGTLEGGKRKKKKSWCIHWRPRDQASFLEQKDVERNFILLGMGSLRVGAWQRCCYRWELFAYRVLWHWAALFCHQFSLFVVMFSLSHLRVRTSQQYSLGNKFTLHSLMNVNKMHQHGVSCTPDQTHPQRSCRWRALPLLHCHCLVSGL